MDVGARPTQSLHNRIRQLANLLVVYPASANLVDVINGQRHMIIMEKNTKPSQRERFEQAARDLGVDLDEAKLKETLRNIAKRRTPRKDDVNRGGA